MKRKLFYNVLLNLGIVILILMGSSAFKNGQSDFLVIAIVGIASLIWLKVRLLKQVKQVSEK